MLTDKFAEAANQVTPVNVAARVYRRVQLRQLGGYTATLYFNNGETTVADWVVRSLTETRQAKNVLMFIGDGMSTAMISVRQSCWPCSTYKQARSLTGATRLLDSLLTTLPMASTSPDWYGSKPSTYSCTHNLPRRWMTSMSSVTKTACQLTRLSPTPPML